MQGSVYRLSLTGVDDDIAHPHVVVLTFSGNRDCIVIPAYSDGGFKIKEYVDACKQAGRPDEHIYVRLDNSKHIDFTSPFSAKVAIWCVARFRRLSQKSVQQGKRIGQMKPDGLLQIARCLLALAEKDTDELSKSAIKSLRNLIKGLTQASPAKTNDRDGSETAS